MLLQSDTEVTFPKMSRKRPHVAADAMTLSTKLVDECRSDVKRVRVRCLQRKDLTDASIIRLKRSKSRSSTSSYTSADEYGSSVSAENSPEKLEPRSESALSEKALVTAVKRKLENEQSTRYCIFVFVFVCVLLLCLAYPF